VRTVVGVASVQVGGFNDVDRSGETDELVQWMGAQRSGASARQAQLLEAQPGERVLDLGCGPGADLGLLAAAVGDGFAVGIDRSWAMAAAASSGGHVLCSDAGAIGVRSQQLDAVWVRAVLLHVTSPLAVLQEVRRVLRPGGRAVLVEPDHGTHIAGPSDPEVFERIREHRRTRFQNPLVGRALKDLLVSAGFEQVTASPVTVHFDDFVEARAAGGPFDRAVDDAVANGAISAEQGAWYLEKLEAANRRGGFFFAACSVVATGRRPDESPLREATGR
jgi:ubiquinone/menaquinone biosynthesis C-methylase UbiE